MIKNKFIVTTFVISAISLFTNAQIESKVIYEKDTSVPISEVSNARILDLSRSVAAMVDRSYLNSADGGFVSRPSNLIEFFNICSDERYAHEPSFSDCSGFLIAPDLIATAGHCISPKVCSHYTWIFDYNKPSSEIYSPNENVYSCKEVITRENNEYKDFAIVKLDRPVLDRKPLKLRTTAPASVGTNVFALSFPLGLPMKFSGMAQILSWKSSMYNFNASLNIFEGSSGSPIFNASTYQVEGILSNGNKDFYKDNGCYRYKICTNAKCDGETVSNISFIVNYLK